MQPRPSAGNVPQPVCGPCGTSEVSGKGIDGPKLAAEAEALIAKHNEEVNRPAVGPASRAGHARHLIMSEVDLQPEPGHGLVRRWRC